MEKVIQCQGVTKVFGEGATRVDALRGVDLEMNQGKLLMIVGPSGSGKTTLISILAGILNPTEGVCTVLGQDLHKMHNSELTHFRRKHIGFVFQAFNLVPMLTTAENVSVPLILNGVDHTKAIERAKELLIRYGLEDKLKEYPNNLSGGQQQRVAIARSTIHNPDLVVCDEPTSSLDAHTGGKVMDLLTQEALNHSRSLVIVTHDVRIFHHAHRIVELEDGRLKEHELK